MSSTSFCRSESHAVITADSGSSSQEFVTEAATLVRRAAERDRGVMHTVHECGVGRAVAVLHLLQHRPEHLQEGLDERLGRERVIVLLHDVSEPTWAFRAVERSQILACGSLGKRWRPGVC